MDESHSMATALSYSFEELCTPHYKDLVLYALRMVPGRQSDARDLVQETFLRAMRRWASWRPTTGEDPARAARGWLHRILQNVFLDGARAHVAHRDLEDTHLGTIVTNTYGTVDDHVAATVPDDIGDEVQAALDSLDANQRVVVVLADFQGEQYEAIATMLKIPLGTVMSRLHRARKRLETALKDYARTNYGICRRAKSDRARATAAAAVATQEVEPDPDGVESIMADDDGGDLLVAEA